MRVDRLAGCGSPALCVSRTAHPRTAPVEFSYAQVFRAGLDKANLVVEKALDGARREGYRQGLARGCEVTKAKYSVDYYCAKCRKKHLTIMSEEAKNDAARLMFEAGWYSPRCSSV